MTQANNDFAYEQMGLQGFQAADEIYIFAGAPTSQQAAGAIKGQMHRIVANGTANASLALKSILSSDNPGLVILFNDAPSNSVVVFPFKAFGAGATDTAETINGGASFTVSAGNFAIFIATPIATKRKGGTASTLNWQAQLYT